MEGEKMDIEKLFRNSVFSQLELEQVQLLRQFASDIQGKGATEIMRMYMQLNQRVNQIKPISIAQRSAIIEALREFIPAGDHQKLNNFIRMLGRG